MLALKSKVSVYSFIERGAVVLDARLLSILKVQCGSTDVRCLPVSVEQRFGLRGTSRESMMASRSITT